MLTKLPAKVHEPKNRKTLESTLMFNIINVQLYPKRGVHASSLMANLQLKRAARILNTVTDKSNLHMRNSLNKLINNPYGWNIISDDDRVYFQI